MSVGPRRPQTRPTPGRQTSRQASRALSRPPRRIRRPPHRGASTGPIANRLVTSTVVDTAVSASAGVSVVDPDAEAALGRDRVGLHHCATVRGEEGDRRRRGRGVRIRQQDELVEGRPGRPFGEEPRQRLARTPCSGAVAKSCPDADRAQRRPPPERRWAADATIAADTSCRQGPGRGSCIQITLRRQREVLHNGLLGQGAGTSPAPSLPSRRDSAAGGTGRTRCVSRLRPGTTRVTATSSRSSTA